MCTQRERQSLSGAASDPMGGGPQGINVRARVGRMGNGHTARERDEDAVTRSV